ncbi:sensor domain-containing protein, partial [Paracraurococcus lichenis]
ERAAAEERARVTRVLAEREGALRAVFDTGSVGVAELDATNDRYVRVNRRFCEITGRTEVELLGGLGPDNTLHPDNRAAVLCRRRAAIAERGFWDDELRYLRPDGTTVWAHVSVAVSARDDDGRVARCVAIVQDVTESRGAAERLRASEELLRMGQEVGRIGSFTRDLATGAIRCGPETRALFELPAGEAPIPPEVWAAPILPEDRERLMAEVGAAIAERVPDIACDYRHRRASDGALRHLEMRARYEFDASGRPVSSVGVVIDVTERREAEERLHAGKAMLRLCLQVGHIGGFSRNLTTGAIDCGPEARALHGLPSDGVPITAADWYATVLPEDRERLRAEIADAQARRLPEIAYQYRIRHAADGAVRHLEARTRYEYDAAGRPIGSVGVVIDVTTRNEAEALLRLSLEVGRIGHFRHDLVGGLFHPGPEMRLMHGLPAGETPIPEAACLAAVLPEDRERLRAQIGRELAERAPEGGTEYRIRHPQSGELRHFELRVRYQYAIDGRPLTALGVVIDITERRAAEARIAHMAHHDALTGLPNRVRFRERLDAALTRVRRGEPCAVLCLDLDRFKEVNDTLGHPAGDALLRAVTERLRSELREVDTLARLGGDEFAVVQAGADQPHDATVLARRLVEVLGTPFDLDGHRVVIGTSIGIAFAPGDGADADALLKAADMALYRAKAEGRGCWCFFEPEMDARMQLRRTLELDLRRALAEGEFELHYQPIVGVRNRVVHGLEALIRWRHPERGLVPPDRFIPVCEETGMIVPLGSWVLRRACAEAVTWPGAPRVAINLSPTQFGSRGLVEAVQEALAASGLEPGRLELEITETAMLRDTEETLATLHQLKALGVRIAMDDFGTGYSSLGYLQRFPFDKVKIDRSFVRGLGEARASEAIVRAVAELCDGLDMSTTAEGVETEAQLAVLRRQGCGEAQGYLFAHPTPAPDVPALLARLQGSACGTEGSLYGPSKTAC